jgi:hypothetical protein
LNYRVNQRQLAIDRVYNIFIFSQYINQWLAE